MTKRRSSGRLRWVSAEAWPSHKKAAGGGCMTTKFVSVQKGLGPEGRVGMVRLERGDAINALSPEVMRQLRAAAQSVEDDVGTSVGILTGNARVFSAGFDLKDEEG